MAAMYWLLTLIPSVLSGNILLTAPFSGSHLYALNDIATFLAEVGHNVTLLTLQKDKHLNLHPRVDLYYPKCGGYPDTSELIDSMSPEIIKTAKTEKAWIRFILDCGDGIAGFYQISANFFLSDEMESLMMSKKYDVVIAEEITSLSMALVAKKFGIPIVSYSATPTYNAPRRQQNLPEMINSEPGIIHQSFDKGLPDIFTRFFGLVNGIRLFAHINHKIEDILIPYYTKYGVSSHDEIYHEIDLFFINDHPFFTFPNLLPLNVVMIGAFNLRPGKSLPNQLLTFINSTHKPIIYLSLGTYLDTIDLQETIPWMNTLIKTLDTKLDVSVIFKVSGKNLPVLSNNILPMKWVPQKDLLGSGHVKLFISHCGNNGRIESIFYNVPLLCIPLWADQYQNAVSVRYKKFGKLLAKEDITTETVVATVQHMLDNSVFYKNNMEKVTDILKMEPASGKAKIQFYIDLLIKYGSLDFLQNEVIKKQSVVEIYNLDIFFIILICLLVLIHLVFHVIMKCIQKKGVKTSKVE